MTVLTILASLAVASADYTITTFQATDIYVPIDGPKHFVSFQISQPGAPWELGGDAVSNCSLAWEDKVPTCYKPCDAADFSGTYYARICPGSFEGAGKLAVEVIETWFYEAPDAANTSVAFDYSDEYSGYWCSTGAQTKICSLDGSVTGKQDFGVVIDGEPVFEECQE